jgi:uncharacterized protein HemX
MEKYDKKTLRPATSGDRILMAILEQLETLQNSIDELKTSIESIETNKMPANKVNKSKKNKSRGNNFNSIKY